MTLISIDLVQIWAVTENTKIKNQSIIACHLLRIPCWNSRQRAVHHQMNNEDGTETKQTFLYANSNTLRVACCKSLTLVRIASGSSWPASELNNDRKSLIFSSIDETWSWDKQDETRHDNLIHKHLLKIIDPWIPLHSFPYHESQIQLDCVVRWRPFAWHPRPQTRYRLMKNDLEQQRNNEPCEHRRPFVQFDPWTNRQTTEWRSVVPCQFQHPN